ncbi:hypothetical protein [Bradyrhizobium lablabi]|uniref:hypothetical protein n=1 Tax=Bradyrhizobium lablabi TaxID=722472 RepID=UPI0012E3CCA4|nr:hypothetical protein [Bradyrhizobium lablabi]
MISFASLICHSVASIRRLDANATPFLSRAASRDKRSHVIRARQVLLPMQHSATLVKLIFWMVSIHAAYELLAQNKKVAPWPSLHWVPAPFGMRVDRPRFVASHRGRDGRSLEN